jgi:Leucine-rich repeat (LRR) protein
MNAPQTSLWKVEYAGCPSPSISFWSCPGYKDTTWAGQIVSFDCHGNGLTHLEVQTLAGLEYLDCSFNQLVAPLGSLSELQGLDCDTNRDVRGIKALSVLNCANNRLTKLDLSELDGLQILDCSNNQFVALKLDECVTLQDFLARGNEGLRPTSNRQP